MDDDAENASRVPRPRDSGPPTPWFPHLPAPRPVPDVERLPTRAVAFVPRPATTSTIALAVRPRPEPCALAAWGQGVVRAVTRIVAAAVTGLRSVLDGRVVTAADG